MAAFPGCAGKLLNVFPPACIAVLFLSGSGAAQKAPSFRFGCAST